MAYRYSITPPIVSPSIASHHHSSDTSIPIIAIAVIAIFAAAFLLVFYYIVAVKCGSDLSSRVSVLTRASRRVGDTPIMGYSRGGLSEAAIRSIPVIKFKKSADGRGIKPDRNPGECAVCLSEFREDEMLRTMPRCGHCFHIDCIDVWLQNNANCPFCRSDINLSDTIITIIHENSFEESHEHCVAIAGIGSRHVPMNQSSCGIQESSNPGELGAMIRSKNMHEQKIYGDVRRCLSMNSAADDRRKLKRGRSMHDEEISSESEDHKSRRIRRSFLSLRDGRSWRSSSVQPIDSELVA